MQDQTILTLAGMIIAAIPPTLASLAALRQGKVNGLKADVANQKADIANQKADDLAQKTAEIHDLTAGHLRKVTDQLADAKNTIEDLKTSVIQSQK